MPSARDADLPFPTAALRQGAQGAGRSWRIGPDGAAPQLGKLSPDAKPFSLGGKAEDQARVLALAREIDELQNIFYADGRYKLLVVLQGTDTAGKDGTVRGVFGQTSPLGVHTVGWKAPTLSLIHI